VNVVTLPELREHGDDGGDACPKGVAGYGVLPGMQRSESRFDKMSLKFTRVRFLLSSKRKTGEAGSNISAAFCRRMSRCRLATGQQPKCLNKKTDEKILRCITASGSVSSTLSCNTLKKEEKSLQTSYSWARPLSIK
jgi:hypothetical protein